MSTAFFWSHDTARRVRKNDPTLTEIDLWDKHIGDVGAASLAGALRCNTTVTTLNLRYNSLSENGARAVASALHHNSTLIALDFAYNRVANDGAGALACALSHNNVLKELCLLNNSIGDDGAKYLASALHHNSALMELHLGSGCIAKKGAQALASALCQNNTLTALYLEENSIGKTGAAAFSVALQHNTSLRTLELAANGIGDKGAEALADALPHNTSLAQLKLSFNEIGNTGALALAEALLQNTSLQEIRLGETSIASKCVKRAIGQMLSINRSDPTGAPRRKNAVLREMEVWIHRHHNLKLSPPETVIAGDPCSVESLLTDSNFGSSGRNLMRHFPPGIPTSLGSISTDYSQQVASSRSLTRSHNMIHSLCKIGETVEGCEYTLSTHQCPIEDTLAVGIQILEDGEIVPGGKQESAATRSRLHESALDGTTATKKKYAHSCVFHLGGRHPANTHRSCHDFHTIDVSETEGSAMSILDRIRDDHSTVVSVDLPHQNIGNRGTKMIVAALCDNSTVKYIHLDYNGIGNSGAESLADALRYSATAIVKLRLRRNEISDKGAASISEALKSNSTLRYLTLDKNRIGRKGATAIGDGLSKNTTLAELEIGDNDIGDDGAIKIARGIRNNISLTLLKLDSNNIGVVGANQLAEALHYNQTLGKLYMRANKIGNNGAIAFGEALHFNQGLWRLDLSENEIYSDELLQKIQRSLDVNSARLNAGSTPWTPKERNRVAVLFSAPLVWRDEAGQLRPITAKLNLRQEKAVLRHCIRESKKGIQLSFDVATDDRFQELALSRCGCLHFSGHGLPGQSNETRLLFEDRKGGAHFLSQSDLLTLIPRPEPFKLVFVSACHSEPIGRAFTRAGIQHVICCEHESELIDDAAAEFTRAFYGALFKGFTVKTAFHCGKGAVTVRYSDRESGKFLLLPEEVDHENHIFNAEPLSWTTEELVGESYGEALRIPETPADFLGREVAVYTVLNTVLSDTRLVTLVGESGAGKSSVASAVCHYIGDRLPTILEVESLIYVERDRSVSDLFESLLLPLYEHLESEENRESNLKDGDLTKRICDALNGRRALVVLDGVDGLEVALHAFLHKFFENVQRVKLLLTAATRIGFSSSAVVEKHIYLTSLDVKNSVRLFDSMCPHSNGGLKRTDLENLVFSLSSADVNYVGSRSDNSSQIFRVIHEGVPSRIIQAAQNLSNYGYQRLFSDPIGHESGAKLFGVSCPHANSWSERSDLLYALLSEIYTVDAMSGLEEGVSFVFQTICEGVPCEIIDAAKSVSKKVYQRLLEIGHLEDVQDATCLLPNANTDASYHPLEKCGRR